MPFSLDDPRIIFPACIVMIGLLTLGLRACGRTASTPLDPDDMPLVVLNADGDSITMRDMCSGCVVLGGIGSGKTSGPGDTILRAALQRGVGMLWLCAKRDEADRAERLCAETGRSASFKRMYPGGPYRINCLDFELHRAGGSVESAAKLVDELMDIANRDSGKGDEQFWLLLAQRTMRRLICTLYLAKGTVTFNSMFEFFTSTAKSREEHDSEEWMRTSYCALTLREMANKHNSSDAKHCAAFWSGEWPELSSRTRSVAEAMVLNILDKFVGCGPVAELVSADTTTITPADIAAGDVVCVDVPELTYRQVGQFVAVIMKMLVQRHAVSRNLAESPTPIWLVQDECQRFITSEDASAQAVSRSSKLCSFALTQGVPGIITALGGNEKAKHEAEMWLGQHSITLMCASGCPETNNWFSGRIGVGPRLMHSGNVQHTPHDPVADFFGQPSQSSSGWNTQLAPLLPANAVFALKRGTAVNDFIVEAYCFIAGHRFRNGKHFTKATFYQS